MCVGFASDPVNTESPAFAHAFGYSDTWSGAIVGVFGLGAVSAALLVAGRVAGSQGRMAVTLGLLSGGIALFSLAPWLPLGFVFLAVAGLRLPRLEHVGDDAPAARRRREPPRPGDGALVGGVPRPPPAGEPRRRWAGRHDRRAGGRAVLALPALGRRGPRRAGLPEERVAVVAAAAMNVSLIVRGDTQRIRFHIEPALSFVPDARAPPNGCWPTTAPVGLSLT